VKTRITLCLDNELIRRAKKNAKEQGKSLSQLVAEYLTDVVEEDEQAEESAPITKSLIGML
tara:strand:+ start:72 stop:254 length:183 start_codon:yes stop_codon:yes gene_type:complete